MESLSSMDSKLANGVPSTVFGVALGVAASGEGMIVVSEDLPSSGTPDTPGSSDRQDLRLAGATRLTETIVGRLTQQARSTANAAKAGRLTNSEDEPGVLDLTPLRELLAELAQELQRLRPRTGQPGRCC